MCRCERVGGLNIVYIALYMVFQVRVLLLDEQRASHIHTLCCLFKGESSGYRFSVSSCWPLVLHNSSESVSFAIVHSFVSLPTLMCCIQQCMYSCWSLNQSLTQESKLLYGQFVVCASCTRPTWFPSCL